MKKRKSLQLKLTFMAVLLTAAACLVLSAVISSSAVLSMDKIEDSVVAVLPADTAAGTGIYLDITDNLSGEVESTQRQFWGKSLLVTLIIVIVSGAFTYFIIGFLMRPLKELSHQVEEIHEKNLQQRVHVKSNSSEIDGLTSAFNGMLHRLDRAFDTQRRFSSNAAHELRTPLAVMQTKLDVFSMQDDHTQEDYLNTVDMVRSQTDRLAGVIDVLMEMAQLQSAKCSDKIPLDAVAEEVICDLTQLAEENSVTLTQTPGSSLIYGNDTLVYRAIYNLAENAIKYNRRGGSVTISVDPNAEEGRVHVLVADTGSGIPAKDFEKIFEPLFREDLSRSRAKGGAGLGLALVKEVALLHGGTVGVLSSSSDGTTIDMSFPLPAAD